MWDVATHLVLLPISWEMPVTACVRALQTPTVYMCTQEEAALPGIRSSAATSGRKARVTRQIARPAGVRPPLDVWLEPHALCMLPHCKSTRVLVCVCVCQEAPVLLHRSASTAPWPPHSRGDRGSILEGEIGCDTNEGREKCCAIQPDPTYSQ